MNQGRKHPHREIDLILASKSPRRQELLRQAGISFEVVPSTVAEQAMASTTPDDHVRRLAEMKASEVAMRFRQQWVLGADTEVVIDHTVLGKPQNPSGAQTMLKSLSGKTHRVLTGYCLRNVEKSRFISDTVETKVQFRPLSDDDIDWYIGTREPYDKAGGYAIQGLAAVLVKRIEGSYTNVVGLPICEVMEHLLREGIVRR
jgi:septum formation protein